MLLVISCLVSNTESVAAKEERVLKRNEGLHCTDVGGLLTTLSTIVSAVIPDLNSTKAK